MISLEGIAAQFAAMVVALVVAPLLVGWVNVNRALLQNRRPPPLLLPFHALRKLFVTESVVATTPRRFSGSRPTSCSAACCSPR